MDTVEQETAGPSRRSRFNSATRSLIFEDREYPDLTETRRHSTQQSGNSQPTPAQRPRKPTYREVRYKTTTDGLVFIDEEAPIRQPSNTEDTQAEEETTVKRPPLMYLTNVERYTELQNLLLQNGLQPKYTKQVQKGIVFQMRDVADFQKLRNLMDYHKMQRFTYKLEKEKPLKVVVRGASKLLSTEEIEEDLRRQNILFQRVARLKKNKTEDYDMVVITTDRTAEGKKVFNLDNIQGLRVSVEPKRKSARSTQCFRRQAFGHAQAECTAQNHSS